MKFRLVFNCNQKSVWFNFPKKNSTPAFLHHPTRNSFSNINTFFSTSIFCQLNYIFTFFATLIYFMNIWRRTHWFYYQCRKRTYSYSELLFNWYPCPSLNAVNEKKIWRRVCEKDMKELKKVLFFGSLHCYKFLRYDPRFFSKFF